MSKFFCNGADAECSCPILCADCKSADWTGGTEIQTKADRIRSMTDEELALFLDDTQYREWEAIHESRRELLEFDSRVDGWVAWLKQPYKEATDD